MPLSPYWLKLDQVGELVNEVAVQSTLTDCITLCISQGMYSTSSRRASPQHQNNGRQLPQLASAITATRLITSSHHHIITATRLITSSTSSRLSSATIQSPSRISSCLAASVTLPRLFSIPRNRPLSGTRYRQQLVRCQVLAPSRSAFPAPSVAAVPPPSAQSVLWNTRLFEGCTLYAATCPDVCQ